jgi:hypothetical protein
MCLDVMMSPLPDVIELSSEGLSPWRALLTLVKPKNFVQAGAHEEMRAQIRSDVGQTHHDAKI